MARVSPQDDTRRPASRAAHVSEACTKQWCGAQFYVAPDLSYMEVDVDVHAYAYLARKALQAFIPRLGSVVFETAFVIQARRAACLPFDGVPCLPAGAGAWLPCNGDAID